MNQVVDILRKKGGDAWSVTPDASIYRALEVMAEKDIGAVLVVEAERIVGIFSERDYARKVILQGRASSTTSVRELMTDRVVYVHSNASVEECMALMTRKRVRHLPVVDDEKLLGLVTIGDVVHALLAEREVLISDLENYITGGVYR